MPALADLLDDELRRFDGTRRVESRADVEALARDLGETRAEQNSALARLMSGETDKSSRAYRSAIRAVQRWRTQAGERRTPVPRSLQRLQRLVPALKLRGRNVRATIVGTVKVSADERRRTVVAVIAARSFAPVISAYASGNVGGAAQVFVNAFSRHYSGVSLDFGEVEAVTLEPTTGAAT